MPTSLFVEGGNRYDEISILKVKYRNIQINIIVCTYSNFNKVLWHFINKTLNVIEYQPRKLYKKANMIV